MTDQKGTIAGKIGIGIITCNRFDYFRECVTGVPEADVMVVVNDGLPYPSTAYPSYVATVIQHRSNKGVGRSKNDALRFLLEAGCSHIFLSEDDVKIVNPLLLHEYIKASKKSGIKHFNYAYHGFENRMPDGRPKPPRKIAEYGDGVSLGFHRDILGAFQYFSEDVLRQCGLMDPVYKNMLEHIDHTYRIIRAGFHPPFWWFADLAESHRSIDDLDPDHARSTIRNNSGVYRMFRRLSNFYFMVRNGSRVMQIPDVGEKGVDRVLAELKQKHAVRLGG